jgi:uncharacterized hydrophobic protein (TIGR00271 family)
MSSLAQPAISTRLGFDPAYLPVFEEKLFLEGPSTARRLVNFFALLLGATVIATYGVLSDSTATVIGAMIVAPLMTPIMATTAGVVMGSAPRVGRAIALVLAGIITVIAASYILSLVVPHVTVSFTSNGEIASRINPGLYALLTALGAGAAGAFITSRAEIADSMGGVAIAISLVPPLCVVGISLREGQAAAAGGALLLFLTNLLAILLAGGLVLLALGLGRFQAGERHKRIRRRGFTIFALGILLISLPLAYTTYRAVVDAIETSSANTALESWLSGTSYSIVSVQVADQAVVANLQGFGQIQPVDKLAQDLGERLHHPVTVRVRLIQSESQYATWP